MCSHDEAVRSAITTVVSEEGRKLRDFTGPEFEGHLKDVMDQIRSECSTCCPKMQHVQIHKEFGAVFQLDGETYKIGLIKL